MASSAASSINRVTFRLIVACSFLAALLLATSILCIWWAVDRIDSGSLRDEKTSLLSALNEAMLHLPVEQDISAKWYRAVLTQGNGEQSLVAENIDEEISDFFGHDRVYVISAADGVIRPSDQAGSAGTTFAHIDADLLLPLIADLRKQVNDASAGGVEPTEMNHVFTSADTARLANGEVAFVSVRPLLPADSNATQTTETISLIASVKIVDQEMLQDISNRLGIRDLAWGPSPQSGASITLRSVSGHVVGFLNWAPKHPAADMLTETAPVTIPLLFIGLGCLISVLAWLRITLLKLAKSREEASYLGMHDPLTGAANRLLFDWKLKEAAHYEYLGEAKVLLVAIDIDHFKDINDTLGHAVGDQLLSQVTERLKFELPDEATLGRLGGDEFAIVQPAVVSEGQALWICQRLANTLQQPFQLDDSNITITFSLGIALEDGATVPPLEILRRADVALYVAKKEGRNRLELYQPGMDHNRRERRTLEVELRNALVTGDGLYLAYQPVFTALGGEIAGAEALVRWKHATRGNMSPDQFIGLAEETGLINQLGLWVLQEACRTAMRIGLPSVAVNVSPLQFRDEALADRILDVLKGVGLAASRLEIEITEGLLLQNSSAVQNTLGILRKAGVRIALDDFGTGYSSISYLRSYAIDRLKIDRSFTAMIAEDKVTSSIVRSVIEMADAMGMSVTAEGVEDEAQRRILVQMGCSHLQGFLLAKPLSDINLATLLSAVKQTPYSGRLKIPKAVKA